MTLILDRRFPRTLDALLDRFGREAERGTRLQAWTFDDLSARRAAEARLAGFGVEARLRSAYKPLLHAFLEEVDLEGLAQVRVRYPVHPRAAAPNRFRLEAYPLAALVGTAAIHFAPAAATGLSYAVELAWTDGRRRAFEVFAPNRVHADPVGAPALSPTGWLQVGTGAPQDGDRLETEVEALFSAALAAVSAQDWPGQGPFFGELNLSATLPFAERRLAVAEETVSLQEALHEDLYFSLLEIFGARAGLARGDRGMRPGQIVPEIRRAPGDPHLRIETRPLSREDPEGWEGAAEAAEAPLSAAAVRRALDAVGGEDFAARSLAGRIVPARHRRGRDRGMMISGGQHPNEPSGIAGALRAGARLAGRDGAHFTLSPLENPDGQALHLRLCRSNPSHMHHAARYTAAGDDLEYRDAADPGERAIRVEAVRRAEPLLHVNLHGYPAHEWTRPLTGYVPFGFALWTLPKGFFLILRHHADWEGRARALTERVTRRLAGVPGLLSFTERQLALYRAHTGEPGFEAVNGFPCLFTVDDRQAVPLTLITEYPDETIYGEAFRAAHEAQMETVLAAYDALQAMPGLPGAA